MLLNELKIFEKKKNLNTTQQVINILRPIDYFKTNVNMFIRVSHKSVRIIHRCYNGHLVL